MPIKDPVVFKPRKKRIMKKSIKKRKRAKDKKAGGEKDKGGKNKGEKDKGGQRIDAALERFDELIPTTTLLADLQILFDETRCALKASGRLSYGQGRPEPMKARVSRAAAILVKAGSSSAAARR